MSSYPLSSHRNDGMSHYGGGDDDDCASRRDVVGYANNQVPIVRWPNNAKVALNLVLNYEEGGENCLLHGDTESEKLLSEIVGAGALVGQRHANMESLYDYGSRTGFWRIHDLLRRKQVTCTVFAVGMALERNPAVAKAMVDAGWEVASHGYRWWDYQNINEDVEREHIHRCVQIHKDMLGIRPVGMYQGKPNVHNTRRLVVEEGGFLYDSDSYADDLPYWTNEYDNRRPHLIIPYTLSENDMRFVIPNGFANADDFSKHLMNTLDYLVEEGKRGSPKMMSVGLHCRLVGRPGRAKGLEDFLDYARGFGDDVWICRRDEIAKHWYQNHYPEDLTSNL